MRPSGPARRVLVLSAMPIELTPFTRGQSLARRTLAGTTVHRGTLAGTTTEVVAVVVGVGPVRAAAVTETLLQALEVDRVVMIGIAGALDPTLAIGDLVVPDAVVDAATGEAYRPRPLSAVTPRGTLLTSDRIVTDPDELERHRRAGVTALDMETAGVGAVATRRGVPWAAFRAISDRVQDGTVSDATLALTRPDGSANLGAALSLVARHPSVVPTLLKLARDTGRATRAAAAAGLTECRACTATA